MAMDTETYKALLAETRTLVRQSAGTKQVIELSPEVAELLAAVGKKAYVAPKAEAKSESNHNVALERLAEEVSACEKCRLCQTRTQTVFGVGNPNASLVFVGEAPGEEEDRQGLPFVGRAGQLLTDIIKAMKMRREDVFICNVLKCRPPQNRNPDPDEVVQCEPYLIRQLELIRPKIICCLGRYAAQCLLRTTDSVSRLRGRWHDYHGIPLRVTYHPSYLLRNPSEKKYAWQDVQEVMKALAAPDQRA